MRTAQLLTTLLACIVTASAPAVDEGWKVASENSALTIFERPRKDSALYEFKAVGGIDAPPEVVRRVLDDVTEYPHFMPYVTEARVISHSGQSRVSYQRISPPLVGDRDYTVRVKFETRRAADGSTSFCNHWQTANDLGPAEQKGVTRVKITEGYWLLEPVEGGQRTRATYSIFSDSGGSLPTSILNAGGRTAIPKLFESVRKQVLLPKYRTAP